MNDPCIQDVLTRLDRLESQDEIRALKARYMQWADDKRRLDMGELFWDDAIWEELDLTGSTIPGARWAGREAIAEMFNQSPERLWFTVHYLSNETITVSGDHAVGRWKLLEPCTIRDEIAIWQGGHYVDDFTRRDGVWKISHLRLTLDFQTPYEEGWLRRRHLLDTTAQSS
ncbi:nuclear transport factor 2 family protein [Gordonia metallireducens]|uniref:nuclear transport factor 2 family protein n=1 Tax=Gordonia metallireducens TaxID=2897779 RepID=UPI001E41B91F|nr:nuclear transport factor 2 family protein [Gordonia metallireducens]